MNGRARCTTCGTEISPGRFCSGCGRSLVAGQEAEIWTARYGLAVILCSVVLDIGSVAALMIYSVKLMGNFPTEGIYRLAFEWLAVWNMGTMGVYLSVLGGALLITAFASVRTERHRGIARAGLAGALVTMAGQFLDISLGNPMIGSSMGFNDDLYSALGQAVSLAGASIFLLCVVILWRDQVAHPPPLDTSRSGLSR